LSLKSINDVGWVTERAFIPTYNKKFELMCTRRMKAYSSSCSHTVSLSPAVFAKDWPTTVK